MIVDTTTTEFSRSYILQTEEGARYQRNKTWIKPRVTLENYLDSATPFTSDSQRIGDQCFSANDSGSPSQSLSAVTFPTQTQVEEPCQDEQNGAVGRRRSQTTKEKPSERFMFQ